MKLLQPSITAKFVFWFLFVSLLPLAIAVHITYGQSRKALEKEVATSLIAQADNKANQIEYYLREKEKVATNLSHTSDILEAMEAYNEAFDKSGKTGDEYKTVDGEYRPYLTYYQSSSEFEDLYLIKPRGEIIFSVAELPIQSIYEIAIYEESELAKVFINAKESAKTEISDFEFDLETNESSLYIAAPLLKGAELVGVLVMKMNNQGAADLVKDYSNLGDTGETMIIDRMKDKVMYVTPLRFDAKAAFRKAVANASPEAACLSERFRRDEALVYGTDYRGKDVRYARRFIPAFRWGLIVKMDTEEIFSSADQLRKKLMTIGFFLMGLVVVMAVVIARTVSSPIRALTHVSSNIVRGHLESRARVQSKDEIGELAKAFNLMTDHLVEANKSIEQKRAELEKQKGLLEKVNKELDSFTYTASHDLRAPLRGIAAFANFLEEDYKDKLDSEGQGHIKDIISGANRMNQLIDDLLLLSRISRIQNPYEDVDINELIETVKKRIEFDIKKNNVELVIQPQIPPIKCDRIKITEVFLNLINNAIKFSSKNNPAHPLVEVGYYDGGMYHRFHVKDNGIGIDPKFHEQVFGMFKRLHTNEEYEGTGAGLGIVKKVIEDHGGRIWIESQAGQGASFLFTIPKNVKVESV